MFLMWECSTPFVFMRWGLHTLGRSNSKLYLYNGLTMMAVFFVCRNVMGIGEPHALANSLFLEFLPHLLACIARDGPQGSIKIFFA